MTSYTENPWSENETDTGTTTEANESIEVDDDVSHKASENKESFSPFGPVKFLNNWPLQNTTGLRKGGLNCPPPPPPRIRK